jgi:hypothetical protein
MARRSLITVAVALMLAALGVLAPGATAAAQSAERTEVVSLELQPRKGTLVQVQIHPLLGVAVIQTWLGLSEFKQRERSGSVEYAAHIPKGPADGKLDVKIPGIASIDGRLVTTSPEESTHSECAEGERNEGIEFRGSFDFHGNGNYLSFHARSAKGSVQRTSEKFCEYDRAVTSHRHPTLFSYFLPETVFSNANTQILDSEVYLPDRHTSFFARRLRGQPLSSFLAQTVEELPRHVAVRRRIEVAKASGQDFVASSKAKYPESAKVRPPGPFSGSAIFERGDPSAHGRGLLSGPLYVDIYGVKVRVDSREGEAILFNFNPGF